jgi:hypothetical protein
MEHFINQERVQKIHDLENNLNNYYNHNYNNNGFILFITQ